MMNNRRQPRQDYSALASAVRAQRLARQTAPAPAETLDLQPGLSVGTWVRIQIGVYRGRQGVVTGEKTGVYKVAVKGEYGQFQWCAAHEMRVLKERSDTSL